MFYPSAFLSFLPLEARDHDISFMDGLESTTDPSYNLIADLQTRGHFRALRSDAHPCGRQVYSRRMKIAVRIGIHRGRLSAFVATARAFERDLLKIIIKERRARACTGICLEVGLKLPEKFT